MKRLLAMVGGLLLSMSVMSVSCAAAETVKIGLVNLAAVIDESVAGKWANEQLIEATDSRQALLDELMQDIQAVSQELQRSGEDLSEEVRIEKEADLRAQISEYQMKAKEFDAEIQQLAQALHNQLLTEISAVLQWYGDSKGYTLIVDSSAALYFRRVVDLTWEIIREYDELKAAGQL